MIPKQFMFQVLKFYVLLITQLVKLTDLYLGIKQVENGKVGIVLMSNLLMEVEIQKQYSIAKY